MNYRMEKKTLGTIGMIFIILFVLAIIWVIVLRIEMEKQERYLEEYQSNVEIVFTNRLSNYTENCVNYFCDQDTIWCGDDLNKLAYQKVCMEIIFSEKINP